VVRIERTGEGSMSKPPKGAASAPGGSVQRSPAASLSPAAPPNVVAELKRLKDAESEAALALAQEEREAAEHALKLTKIGASSQYVKRSVDEIFGPELPT
jgi:hypothetical protein